MAPETNELRFFHAPANNTFALDRPVLFSNEIGFGTFLTDIADSDPLAYALHTWSGNKWLVVGLPATSVYLVYLNNSPTGCVTDEEITLSIRDNKNIFALQRDGTTCEPYNHNKCDFMCLALQMGAALRNLNMTVHKRWK